MVTPPHAARDAPDDWSGRLDRAAFAGGAAAMLPGVAVRWCIAGAIVATYLLASRRVSALRRHALLWGPLYGIAA